MEAERVITASRFFRPGFVLLTSASPAQGSSLLQSAFETHQPIVNGWDFRTSGDEVVLRFAPDRFSRYVTPAFNASLRASVGGSNVRVIKKGTLAVLVYYIAFLSLALLAGRGVIEMRAHPIASAVWATVFFLVAHLVFVQVEIERVKALLLTVLPG
ncbi:MAG TPA: hypothetical protein VJZ76_12800 [Thermoanaerobaculia bacterium]|nr:hypothetical protein [Thermoanaerobaculia bacterium]